MRIPVHYAGWRGIRRGWLLTGLDAARYRAPAAVIDAETGKPAKPLPGGWVQLAPGAGRWPERFAQEAGWDVLPSVCIRSGCGRPALTGDRFCRGCRRHTLDACERRACHGHV